MQVHIPDGLRSELGFFQRVPDRKGRPTALRIGGRHVVGVAGFAHPKQLHAARGFFQHKESGPLANVQAITVFAHGVADFVRQQFQRGEAVEGESAQRIGSAHHDRIAQPHFQEGLPGRKHLAAGRASGGDRVRRSRDSSIRSNEVRHAVHLVLGVIVLIREGSVRPVNPQALFGGSHTGRTGSQHHTHTKSAETPDAFLNLRLNLQICGQRQRVVPAIVLAPRLRDRGQRCRDLAHKGSLVTHQFLPPRQFLGFR